MKKSVSLFSTLKKALNPKESSSNSNRNDLNDTSSSGNIASPKNNPPQAFQKLDSSFSSEHDKLSDSNNPLFQASGYNPYLDRVIPSPDRLTHTHSLSLKEKK